MPTAARHPAKGSMLRILGVGFGIAVTLGSSIGAGIMRTPSQIAGRLPSEWLILGAWTIGAIYSLLGAWSLAELGAMVPSSGGYYAVTRRAFGDYLGFVVGWTDWLSNCAATAVGALLLAEYSRDLLPGMSHPILMGTATIAAIGLLQWRGIRWGAQFQNVTSAFTAAVFFLLIAAAYLRPHPFAGASDTAGAAATMPSGWPLIIAIVLVLQAVIYTYDGWYGSIYFGDEIRNPGREMPRAMLNGVLLLSAIYLLTNAALLHVLGVTGLAKNNLPVAALGAAIFGPAGDTAVRVLMVIALIALVNSVVLGGTRVLYAMARDGWGASALAGVNKGGTPAGALFVTVLVAIAFLVSGSFNKALAVTTIFYVAKYALSYLAVFWMRKREPDTARPYRAWGYPWTTGAALAGSIAFLVGAMAGDTRNTIYGIGILLASYPIFLLARKRVLAE